MHTFRQSFQQEGYKATIDELKSQQCIGAAILEAEEANLKLTKVQNDFDDFTGTGYLRSDLWDDKQTVTWNYNAPDNGMYVLEFRYSQKRQGKYLSDLTINVIEAENLQFWMSNSQKSWVWYRVKVELKKGENSIQIHPQSFVLLDHLNVIRK